MSQHTSLVGATAAVLIPICVIGFIVTGVVYTGYQVYFHPLAKYPGPFLAKLTDLYSTYHAIRGDRHLDFWRCHEQYGNIVRFGPNSLSFNTSTALRDIYGFKGNTRKARFYEAFWANKDAFSTHSAIDKAAHARKRRVLSQAFSDTAIKSMENHILFHVRQFCANLAGNVPSGPVCQDIESVKRDTTINVSDQANYLTFDIMGDLCFGKAFGMLEMPDNRFAIDLVSDAAWRHLICGTYLAIHRLHLDKIFFRKIAAGRARYMQYSKGQAMERTKMGMDVDRKDFFYHLLNAKDPQTGAAFTVTELWAESNLLIIAGSDTTSTAIAATLFYLVRNARAKRQAVDEVRRTFDDVEEIRMGAKLSGLHYLRACIDEAMRLSPSVGGLLPREVLHGGIIIDGELIPAGTVVGVPHYAIHHNPVYYPCPFGYRPERWIPNKNDFETNSQDFAAAQSAFCPFSIGPRGCIGKGEVIACSRGMAVMLTMLPQD